MLLTLTDVVARFAANLTQCAMAFYALYVTSLSAAVVIVLILATLTFNVTEFTIDVLWPPHRFRRHEIPHENVSRSDLASHHDIEQGVPSLHELDMELMPLPPLGTLAQLEEGIAPEINERMPTPPPMAAAVPPKLTPIPVSKEQPRPVELKIPCPVSEPVRTVVAAH